MVSHQPPGTDMNMDEGNASEVRERDNIYQSHPIPTIPRLTSRHRPPPASSMLAYTQRMREISKFRTDSTAVGMDSPPETVLEIQARHIPKTGQGPLRKNSRKEPQRVKPRRPMSLDELIGRPGKKNETSSTSNETRDKRDRPTSEPITVPSQAIPSQQRDKEEEEKRIRISFVSAADLFDLVDFSLRSKRSKAESIQLARTEDTLRLINEVNVFRSMASRQKVTSEASEKDDDVETASLVVQSTPSPRGSPAHSREVWVSKGKDGDWARRERMKNADPYDSDDEDDDDQDNGWDLDLIQSKKMLLLQPQKLLFRPKRAKRMKLHRSLLSAIPEDERQRQEREAAQTQELSSTRVPIVPSSSSLAAIKGSRQQDTDTRADTDTKNHKCSRDGVTLPYVQRGSQQDNRNPIDVFRKTKNPESENDTEYDSHRHPSDPSPNDQHRTSSVDQSHSSKKNGSQKTATGTKIPSLNGQSVSLEPPNTRAKAHRKIRKLIFLRD